MGWTGRPQPAAEVSALVPIELNCFALLGPRLLRVSFLARIYTLPCSLLENRRNARDSEEMETIIALGTSSENGRRGSFHRQSFLDLDKHHRHPKDERTAPHDLPHLLPSLLTLFFSSQWISSSFSCSSRHHSPGFFSTASLRFRIAAPLRPAPAFFSFFASL